MSTKKKASRTKGGASSAPQKRPGPVGGKRDLNRRQKTETIAKAALELFVEHGVEPVTIDQIAHAAGIAKGSFYRYFDDKARLIQHLLDAVEPTILGAFDTCTQAVAAVSTDPGADASVLEQLTEAYQTLAETLATAIFADPQLTLLVLQESRGPRSGTRAPLRALSDEISSKATVLTEAAREHGLFRELPGESSANVAQVIGLVVVGAVEKMLFEALAGEEIGDPLAVVQVLISLVLDGIRKPAS